VLKQRVAVCAISSSGAATGVRVLGLLSNAAGAQGPAAALRGGQLGVIAHLSASTPANN
jgi:hypothetical protein